MHFHPSFTRYLSSKKSVDDRALNARVWAALSRECAALTGARPLRVLELGAGIGTMIERLLESGVLHETEYTALDSEPENITAAVSRLAVWGIEQGRRVDEYPGGLTLASEDGCAQVTFLARDIYEYLAGCPAGQTWDVLVASAFLDLFDLPRLLQAMLPAIRPGGLGYFSINFDGLTAFEPVFDLQLDQQILDLYHRSMDERLCAGQLSGDSKTGRHLIGQLSDAGMDVLEAGSSDWIVFPHAGCYPADEAYFLHFIIHTVHQALQGQPGLDPVRFDAWVAERHAQIERGELVFIAHQLDVLARRRSSLT